MHTTGRGAALTRIVGDVLLGLLLAALLLFTAAALAASWGGFSWVLGLSAGTVVGALALLRRRGRFGTALGGLGVAAATIFVARLAGLPEEPAPAMALALAVLVASGIRTLPTRRAAVVAGGGLVVVIGSWLAATPFPQGATPVPMVNAAGWLAAVAAGLGGRLLVARREAAVERVRHEERLAMARELHDVVAHHITGIVVQAQAAQIVARRTSSGPAPTGSASTGSAQLASSLEDIEAAGSDALTSLRRVVGLLRDADDASPIAPTPEALGTLVRRFEARGHSIDLSLPDGGPAWPPEVTTTVHRVVQEALTNITRHAPHARTVTVSVCNVPAGVTVEVSDDAPHAAGLHPTLQPALPTRGGYGLIGMRERVETLGGALEAGPCPGGGWTVRAALPVPAEETR
ncbi:signal transduction histidine kinase [Promicromonospora sp. AC04]|uniref:sensor histidine kinase n=1 Tax=Promicromonospora sp. AC04 TaxID=2135723 RepID=UPI000D4EC007|nr:histidine kinase [Promicromonospora sp. AC04]PUB32118.1 signal transduction histidine kinase [Promicromonospora sp. AC04]